MRDPKANDNVLLIFYGCLLLLLSSIFLMRDQRVMHHMHYNEAVPVTFLIRFGAFWCIGVVGAVLLFLLYLHLNRLYVSQNDNLYSVKLSKYILVGSVAGSIMIAFATYFLISF